MQTTNLIKKICSFIKLNTDMLPYFGNGCIFASFALILVNTIDIKLFFSILVFQVGFVVLKTFNRLETAKISFEKQSEEIKEKRSLAKSDLESFFTFLPEKTKEAFINNVSSDDMLFIEKLLKNKFNVSPSSFYHPIICSVFSILGIVFSFIAIIPGSFFPKLTIFGIGTSFLVGIIAKTINQENKLSYFAWSLSIILSSCLILHG